MKKHIYLSLALGLMANLLLFGQSDPGLLDEQNMDIEIIEDENGQTITIIRTEESKLTADDIQNLPMKFDEISKLAAITAGVHRPGVRMGVSIDDQHDIITIDGVEEGAPADKVGLRQGDIIRRLDKQDVTSYEELLDVLRDKEAGDRVRIDFTRDGKKRKTWVTLEARPNHWDKDCSHLNLPCLGVTYNTRMEGATIQRLFAGSGAEQAGLIVGDRITKVDGQGFMVPRQFDQLIKSKTIGETMSLTVARGDKEVSIEAEVGVWDQCGACRLLSEVEKEEAPVPTTVKDRELSFEQFDVFPNPAIDDFSIEFKGQPGALTLSIFDATGQLLQQTTETTDSGSWSKRFPVKPLPSGTHLLTITQEGKSATKQLIIQ